MGDDIDNVVELFKKGSEPKTQTRLCKSTNVEGNNNVTVGDNYQGDININTQKRIKNVVQPDHRHIANSVAKQIQDIVTSIVNAEARSESDKPKLYAKWYKQLQNRFQITSYHLIPVHLGDQAINYLKQMAAIKWKSAPKDNFSLTKSALFKSIWTLSSNANLSKGDVYNIVFELFGKNVISLKSLSNTELETLLIELKENY